MQKYLFIMLGGALGSATRFWVGASVASRLGSRFPYGTLIINITACFVIGLSVEFLNQRADISSSWRFFFPIGFVGAYSTFSTFEWEAFSSLTHGAFWIAVLYVVISLVSGLISVALGSALAKALA